MTISSGRRTSQRSGSAGVGGGGGGVGGDLAAGDGEGDAFVGLEVAQAAAEEVVVDEGVVDQLGEHENTAAGVFGEGLVGALDGVFHPEAEAEVAGEHVADGAEIERHGVGGGAFVAAG